MRIGRTILLVLVALSLASCSTWFGLLESDAPDVEVENDDYLPEPDEFVPVEVFPKMVYRAEPVYPPQAIQNGWEGIVWVQALVDKHGVVREARVWKSSGTTCLDEAAVTAAYLCVFSPAIQGGQPVACWVCYKVEFVLGG
jgi:TonB family protein